MLERDIEKHLHIISRADAKRLGLKRYFTGSPCKNGHISERDTGAGRCFGCIAKWNEKYYYEKPLEWHRKRTKDACKRQKEKRDKNKEEWLEKQKEWRRKNPEKVEERNKKQRIRMKNKWKEKWSDLKNDEQKMSRHREINKRASARYRKNRPERRRAAVQGNYSKRKKAEGFHTADDIKSALKNQKSRCASCGSKFKKGKYHIDHIQPIALGGTNWPDNIQILCPSCNLRKNAKCPFDWAKENGKLL